MHVHADKGDYLRYMCGKSPKTTVPLDLNLTLASTYSRAPTPILQQSVDARE